MKTKINLPITFSDDELIVIEELGRLLGCYVKVDMSVSPKFYKQALEQNIKFFWTTIVGVNKANCDNNGFEDNNGELIGYPNWIGQNWCSIDLSAIVEVISHRKYDYTTPSGTILSVEGSYTTKIVDAIQDYDVVTDDYVAVVYQTTDDGKTIFHVHNILKL